MYEFLKWIKFFRHSYKTVAPLLLVYSAFSEVSRAKHFKNDFLAWDVYLSNLNNAVLCLLSQSPASNGSRILMA